MRRTSSCCLVVLVLVTYAPAARAEPPAVLTAAVTRAADTHTIDAVAPARLAVTTPPRRGLRKPSARRAVLTGFVVGSVVGGTIGYRAYGADGIWYGVYTVGIPCAFAGWAVSR